MHGNVWEWVADRYGPYPREAQTNPTGADTGTFRVLRGGSYIDAPGYLRFASRFRGAFGDWRGVFQFTPRDWASRSFRGSFQWIGFRCAHGPRRQP